MPSIESTPSDIPIEAIRSNLMGNYGEIEERARSLIGSGQTADNPILTGQIHDVRYSMAAIVPITGEADRFLGEATSQLLVAEPDMRITPDGFRHMILRDMSFNPTGRMDAHIDAEAVRRYYSTLRSALGAPQGTTELELVRVLPAIDKEQNSVSVVGAFLPKDKELFALRALVYGVLEDAGLSTSSRLGEVKVLFSTLGRLPHQPIKTEHGIPLLDTLDEINEGLKSGITSTIDRVDVISSTPISFIWTDKFVYMDPPISLTESNQPVTPRFITAKHRHALDSVASVD